LNWNSLKSPKINKFEANGLFFHDSRVEVEVNLNSLL